MLFRSNSIVGNFIGGDSTASISQTGSGNSTILNMGIFGSVAGQMNIGISGDNNSTTFNMATASSVDNYNYNLTIAGNTNTVASTMNSKFIQNNITISLEFKIHSLILICFLNIFVNGCSAKK